MKMKMKLKLKPRRQGDEVVEMKLIFNRHRAINETRHPEQPVTYTGRKLACLKIVSQNSKQFYRIYSINTKAKQNF